MRIVVVGGGSGGHITPVIAVIEEIWKLKPRAEVEFWTDKKFYVNVAKLTAGRGPRVQARKVVAGKLRRYASYGFVDYLKNFDVVLLNIVDGFKLMVGIVQSMWRLMRRRPDVVFIKGGFVGLPVGLAAGWLRIPYVIHDSDTKPGLTNRVLARRAKKIATGMPLENYKYPEAKSEWVGIPVGEEFCKVGKEKQRRLKTELGFAGDRVLVVVTGGSLGSMHINEALVEILPEMLPEANVYLVAGREGFAKMEKLKEHEKWEGGKPVNGFVMVEFSREMEKLFGAADVVVSRAGATTVAELASMEKAVVLVPNGMLPAKHQVRNAEALGKEGAVLIVEDEKMERDPWLLLEAVMKLVRNGKGREELARNLRKFAKATAAKRLGEMVVEAAG